MTASVVTAADRYDAQNKIEMAALYLADGAVFTALDRLRDAIKVVEALAVEHQAWLDAIPQVSA